MPVAGTVDTCAIAFPSGEWVIVGPDHHALNEENGVTVGNQGNGPEVCLMLW